MEVRHIKTCHGLQEVRFLDGALVPVDGVRMVEVCEARYLALVREINREAWEQIRQWVQTPPPLYGELTPQAQTD